MTDTKISSGKDNETNWVADIVDRFTSSFKKGTLDFTTPTAMRVSLDKEGNFRPECLMPGVGWQGLADALMPETWASECSTSPVGRFIVLKSNHEVKLAYCISQKSAKTYCFIPISFKINIDEGYSPEFLPTGLQKEVFSENGVIIRAGAFGPEIESLEEPRRQWLWRVKVWDTSNPDPSVSLDSMGDWITQFLSSGKEPGLEYVRLRVSNTFERDIVGSVATFEEVIKVSFILGIGKMAKDAMRQSAHSLETDTKNMLQ